MHLIKGLGAMAVLVALTAGIPAALVMLGGNPVPDDLSWAAVRGALLRRDDGTVLIGVITIVGWLAWLVFAFSLLAELVRVLSGSRVHVALPGLAGPQRLVSALLLSVLGMLAVPVAAQAQPLAPPAVTISQALPATPSPPSAVDKALVQPVSSEPSAGASAAQPVVHRVQRGDDLWSLAEHYYGQGRDWRKIADANPDVLTGGPDRLQPGWRLHIPDVPHLEATSETVTVRRGDSLSAIAERVYGEQDRWRDIFDANRAQLADPDEIATGTQLRLPSSKVNERPSPRSDQPRPGSDAGSRAEPRQESAPGSSRPQRRAEQGPDGGSAPAESAPARPPVPGSTYADKPGPAESTSRPPSPTAGPATAAPAATGRAQGEQLPHAPAPADDQFAGDEEAVAWALGVGAVGGLVAAAVTGGLAVRRGLQLHGRPVGRRIPHADPPAQAVGTALAQRQQPVTLATLDLALRAIAAHCHHTGMPLPALAVAKVTSDLIEFQLQEPAGSAPVGFRAIDRSWLLDRVDAAYLDSVPGVTASARPYPALVCIGRDCEDRQILVDLEAAGLLSLEASDQDVTDGVLAALAVELSFSPWADEALVTIVGGSLGLPAVLGKHNVTQAEDVDELLGRLERRAEVQRAHQQHGVLGQNRLDPDLAESWTPEVVLVHCQLSDEQRSRLAALVTSEPRVPVAAVIVGSPVGAEWSLQLTLSPAGTDTPATAVLRPLGLEVRPEVLSAPAGAAVVALTTATGSSETTPAQWWDHGTQGAARAPDNVTYLGRRFGGWGGDVMENGKGPGVVADRSAGTKGDVPPVLRLLGPVDLVGAAGPVPPRAAKQCLEYCAWLLDHPGTTASQMASALVVAEGTRRSNMSRLRTWLGADAAGAPYLPDAYTGRIVLHPAVSSDWQHLQILTAGGVNRTSVSGLRAALELVRGAPLADAAPGQWLWAEELRTDMVSAVRDIGVQLAELALLDHDLDLARWAASRGLAAAPGDELLMAARIRTEHLAGNTADTERLTLQLAAQARALGVDLESETVALLQEVMEGRVRARHA